MRDMFLLNIAQKLTTCVNVWVDPFLAVSGNPFAYSFFVAVLVYQENTKTTTLRHQENIRRNVSAHVGSV